MARGGDAGSEQARHEPTARRIADARRSGLVAQSADLRGALALAATCAALAWQAPAIAGQLATDFAAALRGATRADALTTAAARALDTGARVLALPLAVAFVVTLLVGVLQTGGLGITSPRAERGAPAPGMALRRGWGRPPAFAAMLAGVAKAALLAVVAAATLSALLPQLPRLAGLPAARAMAAFGAAARVLGARLLPALVLIGAADYLWARARLRRALRMTTRQVERERREREGDPLPRAERRRLHGELAGVGPGGDLARAVATADLVVTGVFGPDENALAVALSYDRGGTRAPVVAAVGRRAAAVPLVAAARAAGVPIVDDAALASALLEIAVGAEIPASAYERVAEILRDVLRAGERSSLRASIPRGASRTDA